MANKILITIVIILTVIGLMIAIPDDLTSSWDFYLSVWGPANLLVKGQAPYQIFPPYGPYVATWWPQIIGANFWMGWLPFGIAAKIWLVIEWSGFAYAIWLLNGHKKLEPRKLGLTLLIILLFPPIYTHLHLGQYTLLFISMMLIFVFSKKTIFSSEKTPWWSLLLLVLSAAKPQLIILIFPCILASILQKKGWAGLIRLIGMAAGFILLCLLPLFILYPDWISGFLKATIHNLNAGWALPTPFFQLSHHLGTVGIMIWVLIYLSALGSCLYLWLRKGPQTGMIWSMALTPIVTIYCFSWDFTLLLPLFFWLFFHFESIWSRAGLLAGMFVVDIWQIIPRLGKTNVPEHTQWWVPLTLLLVCILSMQIEKWKAPQSVTLPLSRKADASKITGHFD